MKEVLHVLVVNGQCTLGLGKEQVNEEEELDPEVVGDHVEKEAKEVISKGEKTENDPVGQPFLVVMLPFWLNSFNRLGSGVDNSDT